MNSQYEINLRSADALTAADRAFRLKSAVKDMAAQRGLVATFMGKPFNDQGGSGTHLHLSLNREGRNAFDAPGEDHGVAAELHAFVAGVLAHAPALMAFLNPTINAYRRLQPDSLAPTQANWGWDNRSAFIRIPPERGAGDAGRDPRRRRRRQPVPGDRRRAGGRRGRDPRGDDAPPPATLPARGLPNSLDAALDALEADVGDRRRARRRRSSTRSSRSSGSRSSATARGSRTGRSTSTSTTSDRPRNAAFTFASRPVPARPIACRGWPSTGSS